MKSISLFLLLTSIIYGCSQFKEKKAVKTSEPIRKEINKEDHKELPSSLTTVDESPKIFSQVLEFPAIHDSNEFITDVIQLFNIEVDESKYQQENEKITTYKTVELFGSDEVYYFIEYDYLNGCGASYPWKYQFLISKNGTPIQSFSGLRYQFITIFEN